MRQCSSGQTARNAAVLERADGTLATSGRTAALRPFLTLPTDAPGAWLWPSAGYVSGATLWIFASEMHGGEDGGPWSFSYTRTWLLRFDARTLALGGRVKVPRSDDIIWGASLLVDGRWLDVFGIHEQPSAKHPHLARVLAGAPGSTWEYWQNGDWRHQPNHLWHWLPAVASEYSVVRNGSGFALVTHDPWLGPVVRAFRAPRIGGPWRALGAVFRPPVPAGAYSYNTLVHRDADRSTLLLSYSLGRAGDDPPAIDPDIARPRFARLRLSCLGR